jgi:hypothetical protein
MLYILHHSKGALMLSAGNRDQVLQWSRRQLGSRAGLFSVSDGICMEALNTVEKDGTGIGRGNDAECQPLMGVMANLAQEVHGEQGSSESHSALPPGTQPGVRPPTWH